MAKVYDEIVALTDECCRVHLDDEYRELARELAAALARKRPSPLLSGRPATWACGIVFALGRVNFLFDPKREPPVTATDLSKAFGISASTAAATARKIEALLNIGPLDPQWTLRSRLADNPAAWMITVNGFIVDARTLSRELQELAFEKGLIPYVPD
jgi:hypothetical protein